MEREHEHCQNLESNIKISANGSNWAQITPHFCHANFHHFHIAISRCAVSKNSHCFRLADFSWWSLLWLANETKTNQPMWENLHTLDTRAWFRAGPPMLIITFSPFLATQHTSRVHNRIALKIKTNEQGSLERRSIPSGGFAKLPSFRISARYTVWIS